MIGIGSVYRARRGLRTARVKRRVAAVLLSLPDDTHYAWPLACMADVGAGSVYVALSQMETDGWIYSDWDKEASAEDWPPGRRFYRVTAGGRQQLKMYLRLCILDERR